MINTPAQIETGTNAQLFYGPIDESKYPPYARDKIISKFTKPNSADSKARQAMWGNYEGLLKHLQQREDKEGAVEMVYSYIEGLNDFAKKQLDERPKGGLGVHLQEVSDFSRNFLLDEKGKSRFPETISSHNARLLAYVVAPMHDVLKFLGPPSAQIMPDHEVVTAELIQSTFKGRKVKLGDGNYTLTGRDVEFVAGVIKDHENIEKEEERTEYVSSTSEVERAKALFFVADIMTGVIEPSIDNKNYRINPDQLKRRFTDLYFRHIDLVEGKIFRPQWGAYAVKDIFATLDVLQKQGLVINPDIQGRNFVEIIVKAALEAIDMAVTADVQRRLEETGPVFTQQQKKAISKAREQLNKLLQVKEKRDNKNK